MNAILYVSASLLGAAEFGVRFDTNSPEESWVRVEAREAADSAIATLRQLPREGIEIACRTVEGLRAIVRWCGACDRDFVRAQIVRIQMVAVHG